MAGSVTPSSWTYSAVRVAIGHALLAADQELTARELEIPTGRPGGQSNLKKEAEKLAELGLVTKVPHPSRRDRLGAPPRDAFVLADEQRRVAEQVLADIAPRPPKRRRGSAPQATLARGQEVVIADVRNQAVGSLLEVLAKAEEATAAWTVEWGSEVVFVFDEEEPTRAAQRLESFLDGARIPVRRASVSRVMAPTALAEEAATAAEARRRGRTARAAADATG